MRRQGNGKQIAQSAATEPVAVEKRKRGRPSSYSLKTAKHICSELTKGRGLNRICTEDAGMPSCQTVWNWLLENSDFLGMYTRAREAQAEFMADELTAISDETPTVEIPTRNGSYTALDRAGIERNRLRVDARKWAASKLLPRKYGERIAHDVETTISVIRVPTFPRPSKLPAMNPPILEATPASESESAIALATTPVQLLVSAGDSGESGG